MERLRSKFSRDRTVRGNHQTYYRIDLGSASLVNTLSLLVDSILPTLQGVGR